VTPYAVFLLLAPGALASDGTLTTTHATVALIAQFESPSDKTLLVWIAPVVEEIFRPAGLSIRWYETREAAPADAARILDVRFHGDCRPITSQAGSNVATQSRRLGWVFTHNGEIADEIIISCGALRQFAVEAQDGTASRPFFNLALVRLEARVIAHELLHVLLMSGYHGDSDFTSAHLYHSDWRRVGRLTDREAESLRRLNAPRGEPVVSNNILSGH
jgi:hypothetical protein